MRRSPVGRLNAWQDFPAPLVPRIRTELSLTFRGLGLRSMPIIPSDRLRSKLPVTSGCRSRSISARMLSRYRIDKREVGLPATLQAGRGLMCFSNARFKSDRDARSVDRSGFCFDE